MVGIFHAYEGETETPYVQVGDQVEKGQIIGAVEAMKLINPLEADIPEKLQRYLWMTECSSSMISQCL